MSDESNRRRHTDRNRNAVKHKYDKQLVMSNLNTNNNQVNTVLFTATYPCVIMGLIVDGVSIGSTAALEFYGWVIVLVEQGDTLNNMSLGNGTTMYSPEQSVMCFGSGITNVNWGNQHHKKTKTGRKLRAGDQIVFTVASTTAVQMDHMYSVQFFLKI